MGERQKGSRERRVSILGTSIVAALVAIVVAPIAVLASHKFSDVPDSHPFQDEISWLADTGISTGFPNGTFRRARA